MIAGTANAQTADFGLACRPSRGEEPPAAVTVQFWDHGFRSDRLTVCLTACEVGQPRAESGPGSLADICIGADIVRVKISAAREVELSQRPTIAVPPGLTILFSALIADSMLHPCFCEPWRRRGAVSPRRRHQLPSPQSSARFALGRAAGQGTCECGRIHSGLVACAQGRAAHHCSSRLAHWPQCTCCPSCSSLRARLRPLHYHIVVYTLPQATTQLCALLVRHPERPPAAQHTPPSRKHIPSAGEECQENLHAWRQAACARPCSANSPSPQCSAVQCSTTHTCGSHTTLLIGSCPPATRYSPSSTMAPSKSMHASFATVLPPEPSCAPNRGSPIMKHGCRCSGLVAAGPQRPHYST